MNNSAALKRQMRYQQWVEEVKDFNSRPKDMTVREWCAIHDIKPPTFYDHMRRVQDYFADQLQTILTGRQPIALPVALAIRSTSSMLRWPISTAQLRELSHPS